jgi:choline dehydrogenase-like flavoprotein
MLIDARTLPHGSRLETDICLIGAGAAGITIAREFANGPARVLLLESGGFEIDGEIQAMYDGETSGQPYRPLIGARLRYFGGSTNHFGGACRILDPIDFEVRPWLPGSGWPIGFRDLAPFYVRAQQVFQVAPYGFETSEWVGRTGHPSIDADPTRMTTRIWQALLNFKWVARHEG